MSWATTLTGLTPAWANGTFPSTSAFAASPTPALRGPLPARENRHRLRPRPRVQQLRTQHLDASDDSLVTGELQGETLKSLVVVPTWSRWSRRRCGTPRPRSDRMSSILEVVVVDDGSSFPPPEQLAGVEDERARGGAPRPNREAVAQARNFPTVRRARRGTSRCSTTTTSGRRQEACVRRSTPRTRAGCGVRLRWSRRHSTDDRTRVYSLLRPYPDAAAVGPPPAQCSVWGRLLERRRAGPPPPEAWPDLTSTSSSSPSAGSSGSGCRRRAAPPLANEALVGCMEHRRSMLLMTEDARFAVFDYAQRFSPRPPRGPRASRSPDRWTFQPLGRARAPSRCWRMRATLDLPALAPSRTVMLAAPAACLDAVRRCPAAAVRRVVVRLPDGSAATRWAAGLARARGHLVRNPDGEERKADVEHQTRRPSSMLTAPTWPRSSGSSSSATASGSPASRSRSRRPCGGRDARVGAGRAGKRSSATAGRRRPPSRCAPLRIASTSCPSSSSVNRSCRRAGSPRPRGAPAARASRPAGRSPRGRRRRAPPALPPRRRAQGAGSGFAGRRRGLLGGDADVEPERAEVLVLVDSRLQALPPQNRNGRRSEAPETDGRGRAKWARIGARTVHAWLARSSSEVIAEEP